MTRVEKIAEAQQLRAEGLTYREIGERMGYARSTVREWLNDPDLSQARARKASYGTQPCVDCGAPTKFGAANGYADTPRCLRCAADRRMIWTETVIVAAIREWVRLHGEPPASADWNPTQAAGLGDPERAQRFEQDARWPHTMTVIQRFGSWNTAIRSAGFEPRAAHGGDGNSWRQRRFRKAAAA